MPALENIRHERFARALIRTGVKAQAYLKAGYRPVTRNGLDAAACRLARSRKVKHRIWELKRQMAIRNKITVDSLIDELVIDRDHARRIGQPATAISATLAAAKLTGLLVERKESGEPGAFSGLQSEADVLAKVRAELGDAAASALAKALQATPESEPAIEPEPEVEPTHDAPGTVQ